ncbi:MAG: hypothetical protein KBD32_05970 [Burkholderiales bacterium]|nr:hypothetical protein [Burkholderiales bacterium]
MDQTLNYDIEKIITLYNNQITFNEKNNTLVEKSKIEEINIVLNHIQEIKTFLMEKNFIEANKLFFDFRDKKNLNNKIQNTLIKAAIDFYKNNPTIDYPADYQAESEHAENLIKQVESPDQNIDQINFDKLMAEITDIKALSSEFKNLQSELKNITDAIKESTDKQIALKTEIAETAPSDANLAAKIDSLVESVKKLDPFLTALTNADSTYSIFLKNMTKLITDMSEVTLKNAETFRGTFQLAISGDVEKMKAEMGSEAIKLINDLGSVNKQHYQDYGTASKKIFESQNATIEHYLRNEHTHAQNYIELKTDIEKSKSSWALWFSGLIVMLSIANFSAVIYMKNNISETTSTNVIKAIERKMDTQIKAATPPAVTNHKKY